MLSGQLQRWADRGSADRFDRRYSADGVDFWARELSELACIDAGDRVLDVGCGTGGFASGIAQLTGARVVGCDIADRFVRFADSRDPIVGWTVADAQRLPFASRSIDVVLMSLLLHRLPDPAFAVVEAARVLHPGGTLLIKTVAPDDAASSLPYRLFPTMAEAQRRRMPSESALLDWVRAAGFTSWEVERIPRQQLVDAAAMEEKVLADKESRYPDLLDAELAAGLSSLHSERDRQGDQWFVERMTTVIKSTL